MLQIQTKTAYSLVSSSLKELEPGHALPVWGAGTNEITQDAKDYIEEIFMKGEQTKAMLPSEVVVMMQDAVDPTTGEPLFNENTYLDKDQIKGQFATLSRKKKESTSAKGQAKRSRTSLSTSKTAGVDYVDEDNGIEQQEIEETMDRIEIAEEAAAMENDANQIHNLFESPESDKHPIKVLGEDICAIGEKIMLSVGNPLSGYSKAQIQSFLEKIAPTESKKKHTKRQLDRIFADFVRENCWCCSFIRP